MPTTAPTISSRTITSTTAIPPVTEPRSLEDPLCAAVPTPGSLVVVVVLSVVEGSVGSEEGGGVDTGLLVEVVVKTVDMSSTLVELSVVLPVVPTVSVVLSAVVSTASAVPSVAFVVPSVALVVLSVGVAAGVVLLGILEQLSVRETIITF